MYREKGTSIRSGFAGCGGLDSALVLVLCFSVASLRLPLSLCIISTLYSIYIVYTQHALSINQSIN